MKSVKPNKENPIIVLQAMLNEIKTIDSKSRLSIKKELNKYNSEVKQKEINKEIIRRLKIQNKKLMEQIVSLKDQLRQIKINRNQVLTRLGDFRKLNKSLAEALGSCDICWGEDKDCKNCLGNGSSGWKNINRHFFDRHVLPTLEKVYGLNKPD